jgi:hypothetical protein
VYLASTQEIFMAIERKKIICDPKVGSVGNDYFE